jgi:hypothetical protein
MRMFFPV